MKFILEYEEFLFENTRYVDAEKDFLKTKRIDKKTWDYLITNISNKYVYWAVREYVLNKENNRIGNKLEDYVNISRMYDIKGNTFAKNERDLYNFSDFNKNNDYTFNKVKDLYNINNSLKIKPKDIFKTRTDLVEIGSNILYEDKEGNIVVEALNRAADLYWGSWYKKREGALVIDNCMTSEPSSDIKYLKDVPEGGRLYIILPKEPIIILRRLFIMEYEDAWGFVGHQDFSIEETSYKNMLIKKYHALYKELNKKLNYKNEELYNIIKRLFELDSKHVIYDYIYNGYNELDINIEFNEFIKQLNNNFNHIPSYMSEYFIELYNYYHGLTNKIV